MAYVITQNCCKDGSCVSVCPVDCIRPIGDARDSAEAEMLYIDPETCVDCGACVEACPVDAIHHEEELPFELEPFKAINAAYFERHPLEPIPAPQNRGPGLRLERPLRVAIVGAGPAACYAAAELVAVDGVEVEVFERMPTPFGLIRSGVAPDHQSTKSIVHIFDHTFANERLGCYLNVEIGHKLTHADLLAHHNAVIYAIGAAESRDLGIPGEQLVGSHAAADFVGWYNGHPDHADHVFDLSGQRAVIVGNGNVALDVARVLLMDPAVLAQTDIAQHALDALTDSKIDEVVILARRGPRDAAFSIGEFLALGYLDGIDIVIDSDALDARPDDDFETALKLQIARDYAQRPSTPGNKRIVFRFLTVPTSILGSDRVVGLQMVRNRRDDRDDVSPGNPVADTEVIETSLVLRSIGYKGSAIDGLPYDPVRGIVPNDRGRVIDGQGQPVTGVYVTGWIKRGPRGVIGTNRTCAQETVAQLFADHAEGKLSDDVADRAALLTLMDERDIEPIGWDGWRAIDTTEQKRGAEASRPRVKFVSVDDMIVAAKTQL